MQTLDRDTLGDLQGGRLSYALKLSRHTSLNLICCLLLGTERRKALCRGDYMEYAWTLKVTKNDGSDQYTHLVDEGLFIKFIKFTKSALLHSQKPKPF